jgi:hypothetical protein
VWFSLTNNSATATQQGGNISGTSYTLTSLADGTTYYVWLKAKNATGTSGFGTVASGVTYSLPAVTTTAIQGNLTFTVSIAGTAAKAGGNVTSDGGATTTRGVCWNTTGNPTTSNSTATDGTGAGIFTNATLSGLTVNTTYYVRAYATNVLGTVYGSQVAFNSGRTFGTDYAGGYVFYNNGAGGGLVGAKVDQGSGVPWIQGGSTQTTLNGGTSTEIGTGQANTIAIINQPGHTTSAAKLCDDYTDGVYSDWFLPSVNETGLMNSRVLGGRPAYQYYWTSTEISSDRAYARQPSTSLNIWKSYTTDPFTVLGVRAARAF